MTEDIMPPSDPQEEIDALRAQITELQQQLRAVTETTVNASEVSELRRQLDAAREELAALRAPAPPSTSAPSSRRLDGFFEVE